MATERQIAANRANAKKSTGPKSEEGKTRASRNSTRHGLLAAGVVMKEESRPRFYEYLNALIQEFQPRTTAEQGYVELMAISRWRQMRTWTLQTAALEIGMTQRSKDPSSPAIRAALVFQDLADNSNSLHLLQRYEASFDRQYNRALNMLLKLKATRPAPDEPAAPVSLVFGGTWSPTGPEAPQDPERPTANFPNEPESPAQPESPVPLSPAAESTEKPAISPRRAFHPARGLHRDPRRMLLSSRRPTGPRIGVSIKRFC